MKNKLKRENGISMVSLVITIIILIILTTVLIYNAHDSIYIKKLNDMYNDLEILRGKVSQYYNEYGKLPIKTEYTNISGLQEANVLSTTNDIGKFYIVDLEAMEGITLNYGKDYEYAKKEQYNPNDFIDIYIINENSHNIFYVQGIEINENNIVKKYYTDISEPDDTSIDLRYIDEKLIPEGYYYIGKKKVDNVDTIVISSNKEETIQTQTINQYNWVNQVSEIDNKPNDITLVVGQREDEFLTSVNENKGYFKNSEGKVQYVIINKNKWSEAYTKKCEYKDKNEDIAYIPKDFKVSMCSTMNTIEKGLVVQDENQNEYVWIPVPKEITECCKDNNEIETALKEYTKEYREESYTDNWYNGCGLTQNSYDELKGKMLNSIRENGGFYIGRYETGIEGSFRTGSGSVTEVPKIKKDLYPYNFVTCEQAQNLSNQIITSEEYSSSLMFGIQWDLVCKFIENKGTNPGLSTENMKNAITLNSTDWGNYSNSQFTITSVNSKKFNNSTWESISEMKSNSVLLTAGASKYTRMLNIYDFAGNQSEWTLEYSDDIINTSINRGGRYSNTGLEFASSAYEKKEETYNTKDTGFRITVY